VSTTRKTSSSQIRPARAAGARGPTAEAETITANERTSARSNRISRSCYGEERRRLEQLAGISAGRRQGRADARMEEEAQADARQQVSARIRENRQAQRRA